MLSRAELFARLAEGHTARVTVVTPNRRLAQALNGEFDAYQTNRSLSVWEAPDILPFSAFVARLYEDALYSDIKAELPMLLTPAQEEEIWRQVVAKSGLLSVQDTAAKCRDAWGLANLWRIQPGRANADTDAFSQWLDLYRKKTRDDADAARLPDVVSDLIPQLKLPKTVVAWAFDILPPQTKAFLDALGANGVEVIFSEIEKRPGKASRAAFDSAKEELETAARWARARVEEGKTGIAVVVPDLQKRRAEVVRVFRRVVGAAFDVSIGIPLLRVPAVALALSVLRISQESISFEEASRIVRSPFIGGGESELGARMRLEVRLREKLGATVLLPKLIAAAGATPVLRGLLEKLYALRETGLFSDKTPGEWARHFSEVLKAAGFPGERALDAEESQTLAKWHEALGELARLDRVTQAISFRDAYSVLSRICADTLFQPESPDTPIQVLGLLESAGGTFEHLWVTGLTDEAWPLKSAPNPFLPLAQQRAAGIPEASAETSLALDRRITEGWKNAAGEVVFSYFRKEQDRDVAPSPLILDVAERTIEVPLFKRYRDEIFKLKRREVVDDRVATPVRAKVIRGGTRVLSDQAACPFRAFARWRLAAEPMREPAVGVDASKRGKLVHLLMQNIWDELKGSYALTDKSIDLPAVFERAAAAAVTEMEIEGRFAELERARLSRLAHEWFEKVEMQRPPFSVVSTEEKRQISFAGLQFDARIDRMDRLSTGGHAILDYKTGGGAVTSRRWLGERPDEPQLPMYAVSAKEEVSAVAFAKFRPGDMRFVGLSRDDKALPQVKKYSRPWTQLLHDWKNEAESLGSSFAKGDASVAPKKDLNTCRHCGLETLCRVYAKINVLAEEGFEEW